MLEARKRTAIDGKTWWCVFDTDSMKWSPLIVFGRYKLRRDCQYAIDRYLVQREEIRAMINN